MDINQPDTLDPDVVHAARQMLVVGASESYSATTVSGTISSHSSPGPWNAIGRGQRALHCQSDSHTSPQSRARNLAAPHRSNANIDGTGHERPETTRPPTAQPPIPTPPGPTRTPNSHNPQKDIRI